VGNAGRVPGTKESSVDLMSIGEFARQSRLSQKALRLYDELDLLPPARVDPDSGYSSYAKYGWHRRGGFLHLPRRGE
jgi:DNA-binding transcriptional MerR regulator